MDFIVNFIDRRAGKFANRKPLGLVVASILIALSVGLIFSSSLIITEVEFAAVLLGSMGGSIWFFVSLFLLRLLTSGSFLNDFKERFSITNRRIISIVLALAFLLLVALTGGEGDNPWIGASIILVFGLLATFFYNTPDENKAISDAADEIVWAYEQQQLAEQEALAAEAEAAALEAEIYEDDIEDFPYGTDDMESFFRDRAKNKSED